MALPEVQQRIDSDTISMFLSKQYEELRKIKTSIKELNRTIAANNRKNVKEKNVTQEVKVDNNFSLKDIKNSLQQVKPTKETKPKVDTLTTELTKTTKTIQTEIGKIPDVLKNINITLPEAFPEKAPILNMLSDQFGKIASLKTKEKVKVVQEKKIVPKKQKPLKGKQENKIVTEKIIEKSTSTKVLKEKVIEKEKEIPNKKNPQKEVQKQKLKEPKQPELKKGGFLSDGLSAFKSVVSKGIKLIPTMFKALLVVPIAALFVYAYGKILQKWDVLKSFILDMVDGIKVKWEAVKEWFSEIPDLVKAKWGSIKEWIVSIPDKISEFFVGLVDNAKEKLAGMFNPIIEQFTGLKEKIIDSIIGLPDLLYKNISEPIAKIFYNLGEAILDKTPEWMKELFGIKAKPQDENPVTKEQKPFIERKEEKKQEQQEKPKEEKQTKEKKDNNEPSFKLKEEKKHDEKEIPQLKEKEVNFKIKEEPSTSIPDKNIPKLNQESKNTVLEQANKSKEDKNSERMKATLAPVINTNMKPVTVNNNNTNTTYTQRSTTVVDPMGSFAAGIGR